MARNSPTSAPAEVDEVYNLATTAREKLGAAANESQQSLRLLVGHANFLDELMETLSNPASDDEDPTSAELDDALGDLAEGSSSSDESHDEEEIELEISSKDPVSTTSLEQNDPTPSVVDKDPKRPTPQLPPINTKLKRHKHTLSFESLDPLDEDISKEQAEGVLAEMADLALVPSQMQVPQALAVASSANEIDRQAESDGFLPLKPPVDMTSSQSSTVGAVAAAT